MPRVFGKITFALRFGATCGPVATVHILGGPELKVSRKAETEDGGTNET